MSLALIQESAKEIRRLAIAGSPLAVGDFRLKKLIPPLEQAGAKVPVFAQVAKAIADLVNGKEADSAANLLNLSTLLNAILYTQGETGAQGDCQEIEVFAAKCSSTRTTARVLKPLVQALTSTGAERFKLVTAAVERGAFNDLRLIEPSIRALDDNFGEMADLIAEKVLPGYGAGIAPLLKKDLDLKKGKKSDARRLRVLHQLDPAGTVDLCKTALEDGSPDVKAAAIASLGRHEDCLPLLIEQTKAKNKTVREAALETIALYDRPEVSKIFVEMIKGAAAGFVMVPLRLAKGREVLDTLVAEASETFQSAVKKDGPGIIKFFQVLQCFAGRKGSETEAILLGYLAQSDTLAKIKATTNSVVGGPDLIREIVEQLYAIGSPKALNAILTHRDKVPADSFGEVFRSGLRTWAPDKVYQEFSPLLENKKGAGKQKADLIEHTIWTATRENLLDLYEEGEPETDAEDAGNLDRAEWDPRWLDAAIKSDSLPIVCSLARPDHKPSVTYLLKALESKNRGETGLIVRTLAQKCQYPKITDVFLDQVAKKTKKAQYFDYELQQLFQSARYLPPSDLPRLDEAAANLDEKFVDRYLEAIGPLRPATTSQAKEQN
jgi:hypothetical protein